jgi:hypothetical protein
LLLKDAPCTNRSYHRCCPHISWNGSEQGRNVGAKASAGACPESISSSPLRRADCLLLDAKKPFLGKMEGYPNHLRKERFLLYIHTTDLLFSSDRQSRPRECHVHVDCGDTASGFPHFQSLSFRAYERPTGEDLHERASVRSSDFCFGSCIK